MSKKQMKVFDSGCRQCPRLAEFLDEVKQQYPSYFARPVPAFGDDKARLCIIGLAPGMHGANATGRPFTGDHAGILLYQTLYKYGFASAPESVSADDGLKLLNCRITNAVKCLPPQNKPVGSEVNTCNSRLAQELEALPDNYVLVALGGIAHKAVIRALGLKQADYSFGHAVEHQLDRGVLIDCYHCSRYNTQTRRLTTPMFEKVFKRAQTLLK
ncbi:MAG: uracil-DNA glycosylase [Gammaproteobacteria bacterium]|nr:uracil-DNA glycosylase [Gammaproteobacteria bacterium]MCW8923175.1 uracil-DNA glycosylase [Gammaproteobacteria bacterium]